MKKLITGAIVLVALLATSPGAWAFDCGNRFDAAEAAIADATAAIKAMGDETAMGLVHTLIDDAKNFLESGRHNHAKPAAGAYDHARAIAKANAAEGYAKAAIVLASK